MKWAGSSGFDPVPTPRAGRLVNVGCAQTFFSYTSSLCITLEVWDPRPDHLLGQTHTHTHTHWEDWAQHWHTMDNLQQSVSLTRVCAQCILSHPKGGAGRGGIHFPEKAEKFSFVLDTQQNQDRVCCSPSKMGRDLGVEGGKNDPRKRTKRPKK